MTEISRPAEEENTPCNRRKSAIEALHYGIQQENNNLEALLWQAVIAYQEYPFYTTSGLPFFYTIKRKRNGEYSGELLISRKEDSKTLTKSSILLAFHKVLAETTLHAQSSKDTKSAKDIKDTVDTEATKAAKNVENTEAVQSPKFISFPEYSGPKSIGQIFGISYVYSLFWEFGLIRVPEKVAEKLKGKHVPKEKHIPKENRQTKQGGQEL